MFAYKKPFTETIIIEIAAGDILPLHGQIVSNNPGITMDRFLSILEAANAGTLERFKPPCETCDGTATNHSEWCEFYQEAPTGYPGSPAVGRPLMYKSMSSSDANDMSTFRNHGEEIDHALKNRKDES